MIKKNQIEEKPENIQKDPYAEPATEYNELYKQYVNLERDYRDALKNVEDYKKTASQKTYEAQHIENRFNQYKKENKWDWAGLVISWLIVSACCIFFTAACVDGCTTRDIDTTGNTAITVHSIDDYYQNEYVRYNLQKNGMSINVILIDKKGKYNMGDTVKFK